MVRVPHLLEEVLALSDVVTVMKEGAVVDTRDASTLTVAWLVTAMLGRSLDATFPPKDTVREDAPVAPAAGTVHLALH